MTPITRKGCQATLAAEAKARNATAHMPRIACGLAGGRWNLIEPIIERTLCKNGIEVRVLCYNSADGDARTND